MKSQLRGEYIEEFACCQYSQMTWQFVHRVCTDFAEVGLVILTSTTTSSGFHCWTRNKQWVYEPVLSSA
jgi:hypothetical protein